MVFHCPFTSKAITERSALNRCDSTYRYHCMRTKEGSLTEQCLEISWIQDGKCAIYNVDAKRLDAKPCNENLGICPQKQYLSNDVMSCKYIGHIDNSATYNVDAKRVDAEPCNENIGICLQKQFLSNDVTSYSACVNDPKVHVSSFEPASYVAHVTTPSKSPSDGSRYDRTHMPSILVAVSALIAVIAIIAIIVICMYRRRRQSPRKRSCLGSTAIKRRDGEIGLSNPEEGIPLNKQPDSSGKSESTIEDTSYDIEPFYKTRTYEYVEKQVEESAVSIVIIGNPGIGKSVLVEMLHNNFHGKKVNGSFYDSRQLKRLEDVDSYPSHDGAKMIYIIDDCFEDWNQYPHLVTTALEKFYKVHEEIVKGKGNSSVVVTISKWNFDTNLNAVQKARLKQCDQLELIDLSKKDFELDITDKTGILEYHRKKTGSRAQRMDDSDLHKVTNPGIIDGIVSYLSKNPKLELEYPLSCRLFYSQKSFITQKEIFFMKTKKKIRDYARGLSTGSPEERHQYCTLIYMALSGGQVRTEKKLDMPFLEKIATERSIKLNEKGFNFGCCLVEKGRDDTYKIVHEEITKLLFTSFGFVRPAFVMDNCDIEVLLKFVRTDDGKRRDEYYKLGLLVLTSNMHDRFAKKLHQIDEAKRMHIIFKHEYFERRFRKIVKNRNQKM